MKVYADHNVVAALVRQDQRPQESAATRVRKEWSDDGRITLVVSAVHDREDAPPEQYRPQRDEALPSARRLSSRMIVGSTAQHDVRRPWWPVIQVVRSHISSAFWRTGRRRRLDVLPVGLPNA